MIYIYIYICVCVCRLVSCKTNLFLRNRKITLKTPHQDFAMVNNFKPSHENKLKFTFVVFCEGKCYLLDNIGLTKIAWFYMI